LRAKLQKNIENSIFFWYFAHLLVPLTSVEGTPLLKYNKKMLFICISHNLLHKIFTFEKRNILLFFSLNQIFRTFAAQK